MREARVWMIALCICVALGAIMASAIALAAALWSPPTTMSRVYWHPSPPHYHPRQAPEVLRISGLASLLDVRAGDEKITIMDGCRPGYRSFNVMVYDVLPPADGTTKPEYRLKARQFVTHVGWPQPMFTTASWDVGASKHHAPGEPPAVRDVPEDLGLRGAALLGSGAAFNTLMFGSALLGVWSIARAARAGDGQRMFTSWPVLVAMALWLAMFVAWAAFWRIPPRSDRYARTAREFAAISHGLAEPDAEWDQFTGRVERAFGYRSWDYAFMKVDPTGTFTESAPDSDSCLELGWPATVFASHLPPSQRVDTEPLWRLFQMPVQWSGLCVNWMCFAVLLWLVTRGPPWLRVRRRMRRGLCPACAYPAGAGEVCTECGQALSAGIRQQVQMPHA